MKLKEKLKKYFNNGLPANIVSARIDKETKIEIDDYISKFPLKTKSLTEKAYWIINELIEYPNECKCLECESIIYSGKFKSLLDGYSSNKLFCSKKCAGQSEITKSKLQTTNLERYGHKNNMWGVGIREKTIEGWIEKYGVDNPIKNDEIKQKVYDTNLERLGVKMPAQNSSVREKYKATCMKRYGVENGFNNGSAQATCMLRYGVKNPMQHPDVFNKSNTYKRKIGVFTSGLEYIYQGYENIAVVKLENDGFFDSDIMIGNAKLIPIIEYYNPIKNKLCHYFPDIYIKSQNLIIEVKSKYTYIKDFEVMKAKQCATIKLGLNHKIWVCSDKEFLYEG